MLRGVGAFVMYDMGNSVFSIVDPILHAENKKKKNSKLLKVYQYFGIEDMVINVAAMVHDEARTDRQFSFMKNGFSVNNNRYFSVQSIRESEVLVLTANDIDFLKRDFPISSTSLFQKMI